MSSTVLQAEKLDSRITKMTIQYENGTAQEVSNPTHECGGLEKLRALA